MPVEVDTDFCIKRCVGRLNYPHLRAKTSLIFHHFHTPSVYAIPRGSVLLEHLMWNLVQGLLSIVISSSNGIMFHEIR